MYPFGDIISKNDIPEQWYIDIVLLYFDGKNKNIHPLNNFLSIFYFEAVRKEILQWKIRGNPERTLFNFLLMF